MRSRRYVAEQVYLVRWPDGITKVGYTAQRRWRTFEIRGATVLGLWRFTSSTIAFEAETAMFDALPYPPAWVSLSDVDERLGHGCGGWKECKRIPKHVTDRQVLAMLVSIATSYAAQQSHVLTDGRTNEDGGYLERNIPVSQRARGIAR